jgi:hypothetical protein
MSRTAATLYTLLFSLTLCASVGCSLVGGNARLRGDTDSENKSDDAKANQSKVFTDLAGIGTLGLDVRDQVDPQLGLFAMTRFDPNKIPIVIVHGSTQGVGALDELLNQLRADKEIAEHYQVWRFFYSTDHSYLQSANDLRGSLNDAINQLDRNSENPNLSQMVLIGGGLGGMLAKLQVSHSDKQLWNAVSKVPIEDLDLSLEASQTTRDLLHFEPHPMVRRVFAIGEPDESTQSGAASDERLGSKLIELPGSIKKGYQRIVSEHDILLVDRETGIPSAVDQLSPDSTILKAANSLRIGADVQLHSISGEAYIYQTDESLAKIREILIDHQASRTAAL